MSVLKKRDAAEAELSSDGSPSKMAKTASANAEDAASSVTGTFVPVHLVVVEIASIEIERNDPYTSCVEVNTFSTERAAHTAVLAEICSQMRLQIPDNIVGWDASASDEGDEDDDEDDEEERKEGKYEDEEGDEGEDEGHKDVNWKVAFNEALRRERPNRAYEILMHNLAEMQCGGTTWLDITVFLIKVRELLSFIEENCLDGVSGNWADYGIMDIVDHREFYMPVRSSDK